MKERRRVVLAVCESCQQHQHGGEAPKVKEEPGYHAPEGRCACVCHLMYEFGQLKKEEVSNA